MSRETSDVLDPNLPRVWIQPHYSSFNGLRAIAVLGVFVTHYGWYWGLQMLPCLLWTGVDLFFVLSGFLITGILYDSLEGPRFFANFYVRRALRILPLFYAFFLVLLLLTPVLHLIYHPLFWMYPLFLANLNMPFLQASINTCTIHFLRDGWAPAFADVSHLWSLCVEEQFYLLWPAVVWWVRDRKRLMQLCVLLCLLAVPLRILLYSHHRAFALYDSTYTRFDTLLIGAWMALWLRGRALSLRQLRRISSMLFWLPGTAAVAMVLRLSHANPILVVTDRYVATVGFSLIALAFAGLLLRSLDDTSLLSRVLRWRPLSALGLISYGFYLIHWLFADLLTLVILKYPRSFPAMPVVAFVLTLALATLSFHCLERPFLRLKRVLAPQQAFKEPAHLHVSEPAV